MTTAPAFPHYGVDVAKTAEVDACICSLREIRDHDGTVLWRAVDEGDWCQSLGYPWRGEDGQYHTGGRCHQCTAGMCDWCRGE